MKKVQFERNCVSVEQHIQYKSNRSLFQTGLDCICDNSAHFKGGEWSVWSHTLKHKTDQSNNDRHLFMLLKLIDNIY